MDTQELVKRLAIFATLMQGQDGVVSKSPKYIYEKFRIVMDPSVRYPENVLDRVNKQIYEKWLKIWEEYIKEVES